MIEGALAKRTEAGSQLTDRDTEVLLTAETPAELLPECFEEAEASRTRSGLIWPLFS